MSDVVVCELPEGQERWRPDPFPGSDAAIERGCVCPVFLLSSAADTVKHNIRPGDYGLDGLLQKPVAPDTLLETVRKALRIPPE